MTKSKNFYLKIYNNKKYEQKVRILRIRIKRINYLYIYYFGEYEREQYDETKSSRRYAFAFWDCIPTSVVSTGHNFIFSLARYQLGVSLSKDSNRGQRANVPTELASRNIGHCRSTSASR